MEPLSFVRCNPYSGSGFQLQCQVQAPATVASTLDILWFFTNTSGKTLQITTDTFSSLNTIRVTQNETNGDFLELTSEMSFLKFILPTHAGSYFCQVSVSGVTTSFSQSNYQTYDTDADEVSNRSPCDVYAESFTQSTTRCVGNVNSSYVSTPAPSPSNQSLFTWIYYILVGVIIILIVTSVILGALLCVIVSARWRANTTTGSKF